MTQTQADIERPPMKTNSNGSFSAHAPVGPVMLGRIARLLDALQALEANDPTGMESPLFACPLGESVIALFAEELEDSEDINAGLIGWLIQVDAGTWQFAGRIAHPFTPTEKTGTS